MDVTTDILHLDLPHLLSQPNESARPKFSQLGAPPRGLPPLSTMEFETCIDQDIYNAFELIMNSVIINALCIFGSVGNLLCIYILSLHGLDKSINVVLISLAVADFLILLTLPLRKISLIIEPFNKALSITVESYIVCYHFLTLNRVWTLTSNAHVTFIAVERFLAVYFPFQVSRWTTVPRVTFVVVTLHVVFYLFLIPNFAMFEIMWVFDPNLNETIAIPALTDFFLSKEDLFQVYTSYLVNLFLGGLFLSVTFACCISICFKLLSMSRKRKTMKAQVIAPKATLSTIYDNTMRSSENQKSELDPEHSQNGSNSLYIKAEIEDDQNSSRIESSSGQSKTLRRKENSPSIDKKVMKLLLTVCFVYLVLVFPTFLLFVFQEIYPQLRDPYWRPANFMATTMSMFLIAFNSSLNFVIYVANSPKFYGTFKRLISCKKE